MSSGNADVVRLIFERLNRGEIDLAFEPAEDFVLDWSNSVAPNRGVFSDLDEIKAQYRAVFEEPWEWIQYELLEVVELDATRVLSVNQVRMRGKGSGLEVDAGAANIWTFKDGKVVRSTLFQSKAEALASVQMNPRKEP